MDREGWWCPQGPDRPTKLLKEIKMLQVREAQSFLLYAWSLMFNQSRFSKPQGTLGWEVWRLTRWREVVVMAPPPSCSSVDQSVSAAGSRDSREFLNETGFQKKHHIC